MSHDGVRRKFWAQMHGLVSGPIALDPEAARAADERRLRAAAQRLAWGYASAHDVRLLRVTTFLREWDHRGSRVH